MHQGEENTPAFLHITFFVCSRIYAAQSLSIQPFLSVKFSGINTFAVLYNHHPLSISRTLLPSPIETLLNTNSLSPLPQPSILLLVSRKRNHTIFVLMCYTYISHCQKTKKRKHNWHKLWKILWQENVRRALYFILMSATLSSVPDTVLSVIDNNSFNLFFMKV